MTYEYDNTTTGGSYARGKLTKITDPSGNTIYLYDSLGRVTSKVQTVTATPANKAFTLGYAYSSGRQTGITYPSGRVVTYGFDAGGRAISVSVDGSSVLASGAYFPFGGIRKWTWANGQVYERVFDKDGRVKSLTLGPDTVSYGDLSQVFGYDSLNRLVSANLAVGQTQSFTYDANSNRTNATINGASTTYTYPGTNHKLSSLSGATSRSFTYDNAGNVTASAGITYVYDGRGRMKQAGATTYLVNGLGQRVKKTTGSDTFFAYDEAGHLVGEYDSTGAPIQETVWLNDTPVAIIKPASPGFTVYNIWTDLLDSPRVVTDASNNIRWEWANNDPFGNNLPNENPSGLGAFTYNLRFPGQYFDAETGKHYNYFRDYDPALGRYLQSDPIGMMAGPQTFGYVTGQPLAYFDPWGLCQLAVRQGYYILGWKSCDGGDQPGSASPPRPNPRPSPAPASCRAPGKSGGGNCPGPYNPNIPLANIPYHMEGSAGGVCTINCAIKKSLQFGAKEMSVHKGLGYAEGKGWIGGAVEGICGRLALAVGLAIFVGDMDACRSECTILTPVLD